MSNRLSELLEETKRQTAWLKILALPRLKQVMEETLTNKKEKRMYELSDGSNSTVDVSKQLLKEGIRVSHMTVYNRWKKWASLGIVIPSEEYTGRFKKVIGLADLGLD
jgi:hypothetical protein